MSDHEQDTPTTPAQTFTVEELEADAAWWAHEAARMWSHANSETAIVYERTSAMLIFAASLKRREERLREALTAIEQSTREDERGEHWTIRAYLDKHGIFHDNIGTSRRLVVEACKVGLYSPAKPTEAP
jgi:hypothetical protein